MLRVLSRLALAHTQEYTTIKDKERKNVDIMRDEHAAALAAPGAGPGTSGAAAAAAGASSAEGAATLPKLPKQLDFACAKQYLPKVAGTTIWHETQTDRARVGYTKDGKRSTTSWPLAHYSQHECVSNCLAWAWKEHTDHTGKKCPYAGLPKLPGS